MANSYNCSCCKKDGSYCDCYRDNTKCKDCIQRGKPKIPYITSLEDKLMMEKLDLRAEWRKFGIDVPM